MVSGVTAYLRTVQADPGTWTVLLLPPQGAPPQLRERVDAQHREVLRHLRLLLEWGIGRRGGPGELDVDLFARSVLTLAEGPRSCCWATPSGIRWSGSSSSSGSWSATSAATDALAPRCLALPRGGGARCVPLDVARPGGHHRPRRGPRERGRPSAPWCGPADPPGGTRLDICALARVC